jgi:hypothetical protein
MSGLSAGMGEPAPVSYLGSCVFVNTKVKVNLACKRKDAVDRGQDKRHARVQPQASPLSAACVAFTLEKLTRAQQSAMFTITLPCTKGGGATYWS